MMVEVSVGEAIDKYTILEIKQERIMDDKKLVNIAKEKSALLLTLQDYDYLSKFSEEIKQLKNINEKLWEIEDKIRLKELNREFDNDFIELARAVYITNDKRFEIKNKINQICNSSLREEKSYEKYK